MKILLVSYRFDSLGGAVVAARRLAEGLRDRGHRVTVVTTHRSGSPAVTEEDGIRVWRFRPPNLYWVGDKDSQATWKRILWQSVDVWNPWVYRKIRRIVEAEAPDLVHVHKLRGLSPAVWAAARAAGVSRIVQTCHDYEIVSPEGTMSGRVGSWAARRALPVRPYEVLRRRMSRSVSAVTAPSRKALDLFVERRFFPRALCRVVPNSHGCRREEVEQRETSSETGPAGSGMTVLFLGRLDRSKGAEILCDAVARVAAHQPGLRLWLAGSGPLEGAIRRRYGSHPAIRILGPVWGEEKDRLLARCSLVVVPSRVPETFGIVAAEAFSYGKPVVASRIGALPEVVEDGRTGVLVPPGDEAELARTLALLAADPEPLHLMRSSCFERAKLYTMEAVVEAYLAVYAALERPPGDSSPHGEPT